MSHQTNCIYCGKIVDPSKGEGDHVIPATLGQFKNDVHFRGICPSCNEKIGKSEEQLLRCSPVRFFRDIVIPSTSRSRGRNITWQGAAGAPAPQPYAETEDGRLLARHTGQPLGFEHIDQLILLDDTGKEHFIPLSPKMTAEALKVKIVALKIGKIKTARCDWSLDNEKAYREMILKVAPNFTFIRLATRKAGNHEVIMNVAFTVTDHHFRAIAKIAFHYYLNQTQRVCGDEPAFAAIRQFIMHGGKDSSFVSQRPSKFIADLDNMVPSWWSHALGASEVEGTVIGFVNLFRGPLTQGLKYEVQLGNLDSRIMLPRNCWAHMYDYDRPVPLKGPVGNAYFIGVRPIRLS